MKHLWLILSMTVFVGFPALVFAADGDVQEATPEEEAAILAEANRKPSDLEVQLGAIMGQLPDNLFDAVFGDESSKDRASWVNDFKLIAANSLDSSMQKPMVVYLSGMGRFASQILAIKKDLIFEGFYRNLQYQKGGYTDIPQPWIKFDVDRSQYVYMESGAEARLLQALVEMPEVYDAKTNTILLYRGTDKGELQELMAIQDLLKKGQESEALAQATAMAKVRKNGLFTSNLKSTAESYAHGHQGGPGAVETLRISKDVLAELLTEKGALYMGYEYTYFEQAFMSGKAILEFARALQPQPIAVPKVKVGHKRPVPNAKVHALVHKAIR